MLRAVNHAHPNSTLVRAYIESHLLAQERFDLAFDFAVESKNKFNMKDDPHCLCALASQHYRKARDMKGNEFERNKEAARAGEAYCHALVKDKNCAVAAQGLAIGIAEDFFSNRKAGVEQNGATRLKNIEAALGVFNRIKEAKTTSAVLVNLGHCYFAKGDDDRAVESYGAASAMLEQQDISVLLYLARAFHQQANKQKNFSAMNKALLTCQRVSLKFLHSRLIFGVK